jgi:hypoxanthine-guanine phosphoribosyltransferase
MKPQILFTELELQNKVGEIAYNILKKEHDFPPVFICVLNGAFMFFTDLVKRVDECEIDFIRAKSYNGITQSIDKTFKRYY